MNSQIGMISEYASDGEDEVTSVPLPCPPAPRIGYCQYFDYHLQRWVFYKRW